MQELGAANYGVQSFVPAYNGDRGPALFLAGHNFYLDRSGSNCHSYSGYFGNSNAQHFGFAKITQDNLTALAGTYLSSYATEQLADLNAAITSVDLTAYFAALTALDGITPPVTALSEYIASSTIDRDNVKDEVGYLHPATPYRTAWDNAQTAVTNNDPNMAYQAKIDLEAAASELTVKMPESGRFYRIQGKVSSRYAIVEPRANSNPTWSKMVTDTDEKYALGSILYLTADNKLLSFANGKYLVETAQARTDYQQTGATEYTFTHTGACPYILINQSNSRVYVQDLGSNNSYNSLGRSTKNTAPTEDDFKFQLYEVNTLPLTFGQYKLATLNLPVACDLPQGVKAYRAKSVDGDNGKIMLALVQPDETTGLTHLYANDPVLVYAEQGNYQIAVDGNLEDSSENVTGYNNYFSGTVATEAHDTEDRDKMVLGVINGNIGFYPTAADHINGFKAYFENSGISNAPAFVLSFEDIATAIDAHESNLPADGQTYNLNGQKVSNAGKGVYIVNGKKVMIR